MLIKNVNKKSAIKYGMVIYFGAKTNSIMNIN